MERKVDRRSRMTKRILHETLIELLQTAHISELSVKRICEAADLNRSTFYAHYQSPMELLQEIEQEAYQELTGYVTDENRKHTASFTRDSMMRTLEFVRKNPELSRVLLGSNGSARFKEISLSITADHYIKQKDSKQTHYLQHYYVAGWTAVVEEWLNNGCVDPISEICDLVGKLIDHSF